jgi:hypothetical protein
MRNFIKTAAVLALLGNRPATAQTVGETPAGSASPTVSSPLAHETRWLGGAPIGHRQPRVADVPAQNAGNLEQLSAEDVRIDRKLSICRGC